MAENHLRQGLESGEFICTAELVLGRDYNLSDAEQFVKDAASAVSPGDKGGVHHVGSLRRLESDKIPFADRHIGLRTDAGKSHTGDGGLPDRNIKWILDL